jgi:hypothetical protein
MFGMGQAKRRPVLGIGNPDFLFCYRRKKGSGIPRTGHLTRGGLATRDRYGDLTGSVNFLVFQRKPGSTLIHRVVWERITPVSVGGRGIENLLPHPLFRARYKPGLPLRAPIFRNYVQKQVQFYTLILEMPVT